MQTAEEPLDDLQPSPGLDDRAQAGVQSVEIGMRLLAALAAQPPGTEAPMLKTLAEQAGMPPAKAHRYMVSLARSGLVERDGPTGRYRLGPLCRILGIRALQGMDVVKLVVPRLPSIRDRLGFSVALAIWTQHGPTIIAVEDARGPVTYSTRVGEVMPLLASATGRVFGAWLPDEITRPLLLREQGGDAQLADAARATFAQVREVGLGISAGGLTPTINGLSAPVLDYRSAIAAALSVIGPAGELDPSCQGRTARELLQICADLSREMGSGTASP